MGNHDELIKSIMELPEEKAKELLTKILVGYGERIYGVGNGDEAFLRTVKTIYLKFCLDKYKI